MEAERWGWGVGGVRLCARGLRRQSRITPRGLTSVLVGESCA